MSDTKTPSRNNRAASAMNAELVAAVKARFLAADQTRRGVCLLNAGRFAEAEAVFRQAVDAGTPHRSLAAYLAASWMGRNRPDAAARELGGAEASDPSRETMLIRHALSLAAGGRTAEAVDALRDAIRSDPERPAVHFQLGTLLASTGRYEEAELRFTQAINIDRTHVDAVVSLALCYGTRNAAAEAVRLLQRAQTARPHDAKIALLLAQAAKAAQQSGLAVSVRAGMPDDDPLDDADGIEELSRVIETDPDFVDAFISLGVGEVDERIFAMLLATIERALERQPEHAELHFHCGRVLDRLGRAQDAIDENERAVALNPTFTRALIELGKLYQQTDRQADATTRLERAVAVGAEYADVYYLLGNLYRHQGMVGPARTAYRRALVLNGRYEAAIQALETLSV